jgi:hypothetical protein
VGLVTELELVREPHHVQAGVHGGNVDTQSLQKVNNSIKTVKQGNYLNKGNDLAINFFWFVKNLPFLAFT